MADNLTTVQIGSLTLSGVELTALCDAKGLKSKWFKLKIHKDFIGSPDQDLFEEVKLIGGPENAKIDYDGDGHKDLA